MNIAITGSIGAGKSTVVACIESLGYAVCSADAIVRELYLTNESLRQYVQLNHPTAIVDKKIDRGALAQIVFQNPVALEKLESFIFPLVKEEFVDFFNKETTSLTFAEVPLLFESKMETLFDYIIMIDAPLNVRMKRLMDSRQITLEEALKRNSRQYSSLYKQNHSNITIFNHLDQIHLVESVKQLIHDLEENYAR